MQTKTASIAQPYTQRTLNTIFLLLITGLALAASFPINAGADGPQRSAILARGLESHGGLARWRNFGTMTYDIRNLMLGPKAPLNDHHVVDLKGRYHLITSERYIVGFDGREGWITPDIDALGLPPRFYAFGNLYLWAQPFVLADAGSIPRDDGQKRFQGRTFNAVRIGYGSGDTPDDQYVAYFDPETGRLAMLVFSVTHPAVRGDKPVAQAPRKALVFKTYQEIGGLVLPRTIGLHDWTGDGLGAGSDFEVVNLSLQPARPSAETFRKPPGAVVDRLHEQP